MNKKVKRILLVDDDDATNFLHQIIIEEHGCCEEVVSVFNGQEALNYLVTKVNGEYPCPEIIFLDINMPLVDGWAFLEAYKELDQEQRGEVIIAMLTTSLNPYDKQRASKIEEVFEYGEKPLTEDFLDKILDTFFSD